jgi:phosphatidylglycerophosphate synthase
MASWLDNVWVRLVQMAGEAWAAAIPAVVVAAYFTVGLVGYLARCLLIGPYRDLEIDQRGSSVLLGHWWRTWFAWVLNPVWRALSAADIPPSAVTTVSVFFASVAGVAMAQGLFFLGGLLYLSSGVCDFIDGRLARTTGQVTKAGAALDSILDRYSEAWMLIGVAWFYHQDWMLLPVLLLLVGSYQVPYVRARGEALGVEMRVGLMQRPERMVMLGLAAVFSPLVAHYTETESEPPRYWMMVATLIFLAVTTQVTAAGRLTHLLRDLDRQRTATSSTGRHCFLLALIVAVTCGELAACLSLRQVAGLSVTHAVLLAGLPGSAALYCAWPRSTSAKPRSALQGTAFVAGTLLLQAGGVAIVETVSGVGPTLSWCLVRIGVLITWIYPLMAQRPLAG